MTWLCSIDVYEMILFKDAIIITTNNYIIHA